MKIAKEFKWEMGHRLTFHEGLCKNLHGHSYKMMVEVEGEPDSDGMILDYYNLAKIINPILAELDHGYMIYSKDTRLIEFMQEFNSKHVVVDFEATAENMCGYFLNKIKEAELPSNINKVTVLVYETEDTFAQDSLEL
ncbi:MAG: 6-pyruvoyl tetrahydropterin synthase family protein [Rhodothermaceae bacterium]